MTEPPFVFVYPEEAALAGPDALAAQVAELGFGGVAVALAYHRARRVLPRHGTVSVSAPGHLAFASDRGRYGALVPTGTVDGATVCAVHELRAACDRHDLRFHAWLVALHHEGLVAALPEAGAQTVDGAPVGFSLCPSHPESAGYVAGLVEDACAQFAPASVVLEAALFPAWEPAYTLTLALEPLTEPAMRYGMQCFCASCRTAIAALGEDAERLVRAARTAAGAPFDATPLGDGTALDVDEPLLDARLAHVRAALVAPLLTEAAQRARAAGARLLAAAFGDPAGVTLQGFSAPALHGVDGVLLGLAAETGAPLLDRFAALRALAGSRPALASVNWAPQRTPAALAADVRALAGAGAAGIGVYNLSLAPAHALPAFAAAAEAARRGCSPTLTEAR